MSKIVYQMEIQMKTGFDITNELIDQVEAYFPHTYSVVCSAEQYSVVVIIESETLPSVMRILVNGFLKHLPSIHYIDVAYRFPYDMTPDRFVIWSDGRQQEYTGKVIYVEDE